MPHLGVPADRHRRPSRSHCRSRHAGADPPGAATPAGERLLDTDLATWLHALASRLRALAAAVAGWDAEDPSDPGAAARQEAGASLERTARGLEIAAGALCDRCRLMPVGESVAIGPPGRHAAYRAGRRHRHAGEPPATGWEGPAAAA